jgi:hypothetical protein
MQRVDGRIEFRDPGWTLFEVDVGMHMLKLSLCGVRFRWCCVRFGAEPSVVLH